MIRIIFLGYDLLSMISEPNDGESRPIRLGGQLSVVHEDQYHPVSQQGRSIQGEAGPITSRKLLPRLLWWQ